MRRTFGDVDAGRRAPRENVATSGLVIDAAVPIVFDGSAQSPGDTPPQAEFIRRVGTEFLVNTQTSAFQGYSSVTTLSNGQFVVVWEDDSRTLGDSSFQSIKAQLFSSSGAKIGGEFLVNTTTDQSQGHPVVTSLSSGGFVVAWMNDSGGDIRAQIYNSAATRVGSEFAINSPTSTQDYFQEITGLNNGGFVVVWPTSANSLQAQIYNASGVAIGAEFRVDAAGTSGEGQSVTALANGNFVVTWSAGGAASDGSGTGLRAQIYTPTGTKVGAEFTVNTTTFGSQFNTSVSALSGGGFVVTWASADFTSNYAIYAQVFNASGGKVGSEILVSPTKPGVQNEPSVVGLPNGGFVITWDDANVAPDDPSFAAVRAQVYSSAGTAVGGTFVVPINRTNSQGDPRIDAFTNGSGNIIITWTDGSGTLGDPDTSIKAQIFTFGTGAAPTDISLSNAAVDEGVGTVSGFEIGVLTATDPDISDAFTYTLVSDPTNGGLAILGDRLVVGDPTKLDFETLPNPVITVRVTDASGFSYEEALTITVRNVVETAVPIRLGTEFLVNTQTFSTQFTPTITTLSNGNFVVAWSDSSGTLGDNSSTSIKAQIFTAAGAKVGTEFLINSQIAFGQSAPAITSLSNGNFVVLWEDASGTLGDASEFSIKAQVFTATGVKVGVEFLVNTQTTSGQRYPEIASLAGGGFVATWTDQSAASDASGSAVKAQIFSASGAKVGTEFLVNTQTANGQLESAVAGLTNGGFVVTWVDNSRTLGDASGTSIKAQLFSSTGTKIGGEFLVNSRTAQTQDEVSITALSGGGYVITWTDESGDPVAGSSSNVKAQIFSAAGVKVGTEFLVNTQVANQQFVPSITALSTGGFIVTWADNSQQGGDGSATGIKAQIYSATGAKVGGEFLINTTTASSQGEPDVSALANGGFVVAWTDFSATGGDVSATSIRAQIYRVDNLPIAAADQETVIADSNATLNLLSNDTDPDGDPKTITKINGVAVVVNQVVTLPSGATVTINADGTVSYDPNGRYDYLVSPLTGISTSAASQATDSFTYTLNGGSTATATVTIEGVDGPGDQLRGDSSDNTLYGTPDSDIFNLRDGGNDTVYGDGSDDGFYFGAAYTADDIVEGGDGDQDQLGLQGDYSSPVNLGQLQGVELVVLLAGNDARFGGATNTNLSYNIVADSNTVTRDGLLTIQANSLRAGESLTFDGSSSGLTFLVFGGRGTDNLTGGAGDDGFYFGQGFFGTNDRVVGGAGSADQIGFQGNFTSANGGSGPIVFGANQLNGVEFIVLLSASDSRFAMPGGTADYNITMNDGNVGAGEVMIISANTLSAGEELSFNGGAEQNGSFEIYSGASNDLLIGGNGNDEIHGGEGVDTIVGRNGADRLYGGGGNDRFLYNLAGESTDSARDTIFDFAIGDVIDLSALAANLGIPPFDFIGSGQQSAARQVQVIQNGGDAVVRVFIGNDSTADLVINVTVADSHLLTAMDFDGVNQPSGQAPLSLSGEEALAGPGVGVDLGFDAGVSLASWAKASPDCEMPLDRVDDHADAMNLSGSVGLFAWSSDLLW